MGRKSLIGWSVVALQLLLIVGAVTLAQPQWWASPSWMPFVATVLACAALALGALALISLGPAMTASPVPRGGAELRTDGLYGLVRHPIYSLVIVAIGVWALASGVGGRIVCWLLLVALFVVKSRWEERMLVERFPGYAAYREATPAFVPRPRGGRTG